MSGGELLPRPRPRRRRAGSAARADRGRAPLRRDGPRILLNLGGMANLTWVARRRREGAFAFDTGPGMALVDGLARRVDPATPFDVDGALAARGTVDEALLAELLADPYFDRPPPKSTGREHFGAEIVDRIARALPGPDGVATAVELTARAWRARSSASRPTRPRWWWPVAGGVIPG
ncbi:MAG: anhydro-N-acetylmuramic acid kinase [Gemmatimonadales bacterium]